YKRASLLAACDGGRRSIDSAGAPRGILRVRGGYRPSAAARASKVPHPLQLELACAWAVPPPLSSSRRQVLDTLHALFPANPTCSYGSEGLQGPSAAPRTPAGDSSIPGSRAAAKRERSGDNRGSPAARRVAPCRTSCPAAAIPRV